MLLLLNKLKSSVYIKKKTFILSYELCLILKKLILKTLYTSLIK
jgi:hypothetical protein